jgi:glycosyltransferase involved in cell wall biosynthesis
MEKPLIGYAPYAEVAGDAGMPFTAGELGAKLDLVLKMPEAERAEWGRRAMERVAQRYSWESVTDQYEGLLLTLKR